MKSSIQVSFFFFKQMKWKKALFCLVLFLWREHSPFDCVLIVNLERWYEKKFHKKPTKDQRST